MRKLARDSKGQFIVIAVLMISIMVISVATIMYGAVTYYRHERWEEYLSIIDNVEMSAGRLMELSLANYTLNMGGDSTVLQTNLDRWQRDLFNAYPQFRVVLNYSVSGGGTPIYYNKGLNASWNQRASFSAAKASFRVNITSVGLTGYRFTRTVLLNLTLLDVLFYPKDSKNPGRVCVRFSVTMEGLTPLSRLIKNNVLQFRVNGADMLGVSNLTRYYDNQRNKCYVYELRYLSDVAPSSPALILISIVDFRNVNVVAQAGIPVIAM